MTETPYEAFLAGERPDDVLVYLHEEGIGNVEALDAVSEEVGEGLALVLPGDQGRTAFQKATGLDPMDFAGVAMQTDGVIAHDCTDGDCPNQEAATHYVKFVFAFAEAQNEEVGGIYAEGDVIHAYAACNCGTTYSDKWVAGE